MALRVQIAKGQAWRDFARLERWRRQQDQRRKAAVMSTITGIARRPATEVKAVASHRFHGGPFEGQAPYVGPIPGLPPDAPPGSFILTIPAPLTVSAAIAWRQHGLRHAVSPIASEPALARYLNGAPGEWHYVPTADEQELARRNAAAGA